MTSFPHTESQKQENQENEKQNNIQINLQESESENENENIGPEDLLHDDRDMNDLYHNFYMYNKEPTKKKEEKNKSKKQSKFSTNLTNKKKTETNKNNTKKIKKIDMKDGAIKETKEIEIIDCEANQKENLLQKKKHFDIIKTINNYEFVNINNNLNYNVNKTEKKNDDKKLFQIVLQKEEDKDKDKEKHSKDSHNEEEDIYTKFNSDITDITDDQLYYNIYWNEDEKLNINDEQSLSEVECNCNKQLNEITEPRNLVLIYENNSTSTKESNFKG